MKTTLLTSILLACLAHAETMRIYHIGNSLTDQVRYGSFETIAESRGHDHTWARQMIPGSPLGGLWNSPSSGFMKEPYGYPTNAFPNYTWDMIVMQPFDWSVAVESQAANDFWNLALANSPNVVACIHMAWPRNNAQYGDYETQWLDSTHGWTWSRRYFERIIDTVTAAHPTKEPVRALPMGEVMYELDKKMRAGHIPGYNTIWDIYNDGVHLGDVGSYITMTTHYAVIYRDDPVGLPTTGFTIEPWLADTIQHIVRDVVLRYPRCRVSQFGPYAASGVVVTPAVLELNTGASAGLAANVLPSNATDKTVSWSCTDNAVASVDNSGSVTASAAGSCFIVATTTDGGFRDSCALTVVSTGTAVTGVTVTPDSVIVMTPGTRQLAATVSPAGATNTAVTWRSLDSTLAAVDASGLVTAVRKGATRVIAMSVNGGKTDTCDVKVIIPNQPPVAVLQANPVVGYAPVTVAFDGHASWDPDSATGDFVLGYDWDFGDGSPWAFTVTPKHTYGTPGLYTVRLRVLDDNETRSGWVEQVIEVREPDASVVCYEGFEYDTGPLHECNGGQGWAHGWQVQNGDTSVPGFNIVDTEPMAYRDLLTIGNYMVGGDRYQGAGRAFDVRDDGAFQQVITFARIGLPGTTLWASALMRKQTSDQNRVGIALNNARFVTGYDDERIAFGYFGEPSDSAGTRYWGIQLDTVTHRSTAPCVVDETALLVLKLDFGADATTASLYVNPESLGGDAPAAADITRTTAAVFAFKSFGFMCGIGHYQSALDEIRFGYSYASVTPTSATHTEPMLRLPPAAANNIIRVAGMRIPLPAGVERAAVTVTDLRGRVVWRGMSDALSLLPTRLGDGACIVRVGSGDAGAAVRVVRVGR
ncbi:MAG: PKD domain-containing protein [Chitinivibrionales bacterium]|nr:PKD domain-containing protein [Chitinivibrionales bacterium]